MLDIGHVRVEFSAQRASGDIGSEKVLGRASAQWKQQSSEKIKAQAKRTRLNELLRPKRNGSLRFAALYIQVYSALASEMGLPTYLNCAASVKR